MKKTSLPKIISIITKSLNENGYSAYLVGGCVRDLLIGKSPKDWDFTTDATPEQIEKCFENTFMNNPYGTVTIVNQDEEESLQGVEITPYRSEGKYLDGRRPESVLFVKTLEEDLSRRDFTINAIAIDPKDLSIKDPFGGLSDMSKSKIVTVGDPEKRFNEDYLRMLRAVRLSCVLNFSIEEKTKKAIQKNAEKIKNISLERIRDEIIKICNSDKPSNGFLKLKETGLLAHILPEIDASFGIDQNGSHKYDVFTHLLYALDYTAEKNLSMELRLAALLHDIGKPKTRYFSKTKNDYTFYSHEVVGAKISQKILERLKFSRQFIDKVTLFVRWHMFFSDTEQITLSAVRRMIARVGKENIQDLLELRVADRMGMGRPKENPYRLRKYRSLVEEVLRENITPGKLAIDGALIMKESGEKPGPRIGHIQHALLAETLEDPKKNTEEYLLKTVKELSSMSSEKLRKIGEKGRLRMYEEESTEIEKIRKSHGVK